MYHTHHQIHNATPNPATSKVHVQQIYCCCCITCDIKSSLPTPKNESEFHFRFLCLTNEQTCLLRNRKISNKNNKYNNQKTTNRNQSRPMYPLAHYHHHRGPRVPCSCHVWLFQQGCLLVASYVQENGKPERLGEHFSICSRVFLVGFDPPKYEATATSSLLGGDTHTAAAASSPVSKHPLYFVYPLCLILCSLLPGDFVPRGDGHTRGAQNTHKIIRIHHGQVDYFFFVGHNMIGMRTRKRTDSIRDPTNRRHRRHIYGNPEPCLVIKQRS